MSRLNDNWLEQALERLRKGDKAAFNVVFHKYSARIFNFSFKLTHTREDAEEVVQEVFLKVWEKRALIEPRDSFESFLFTIAKNIVYNKARHRVHEFAYKEYIRTFADILAHDTEEQFDFRELEDFIQVSCQQLPPVRREVFMLSRFHGLTNEEIADRLHTSTSNINNHIYKALIFLRKQIMTHHADRVIVVMAILFG